MASEELLARLSSHNQQHLLDFWDELTEEQRDHLVSDISSLDLVEINSYFDRAKEDLEANSAKMDDQLQPVPASQYESLDEISPEKIAEYEEIGLREISKSAVGVLLMAGGQGTRLGSSDPKGMYDVGLPSAKTLFQIQAQRILRLQRLAAERTGLFGHIVWYIMTSEHTMEPTYEYLKRNNFFGLLEENIVLFEQGSLPCYKFDGKIILDSTYKIATAPDGNGGLYRALRDKKIIDHMKEKGIKHLHAHSVDNILIKVADPVFIGYSVHKNSDCAVKVVEKSSPNEAVGVVCMVDGLYQVVEYSEITQSTAELRNKDGKLTFNAGNICNHYFSRGFLERVCCEPLESQLKLHVAKKKVPYVDANGVRQTPDKPNAIKIEKFVFDVFQFAESFAMLVVPRDVEFSALKNTDSAGKECPSSARQDIFRLHRKYLRLAGAHIVDSIDCEISPLLSYAGEDLEYVVKATNFAKSPIHLHSREEVVNGSSVMLNGNY